MKKKHFIFTVDDNIKFLRELSYGSYESLFDHPYTAMYRRLHERFDLKIQLNLFFEEGYFDLSMMPDKYRDEWKQSSSWLKLSFHSRLENENPYIESNYGEVFHDATAVRREIERFAGGESLAKTTTVHWCRATSEGVRALKDAGVCGLLGLYGSETAPRSSYQSSKEEGDLIRRGAIVASGGVAYAGIDVVLNSFEPDVIIEKLTPLTDRELIKVMIHEQYFHPNYKAYQPNFEEKLKRTFAFLCEKGYTSRFFEELL